MPEQRATREQFEPRIAAILDQLDDQTQRVLLAQMGDPPDPSRIPEQVWRDLEEQRRQQTERELLLLFLLAWLMMQTEVGFNLERYRQGAPERVARRGQGWARQRAQLSASGRLGALRRALGRAARDGTDPRRALFEFFNPPEDADRPDKSRRRQTPNERTARTETTAGISAGEGDYTRGLEGVIRGEDQPDQPAPPPATPPEPERIDPEDVTRPPIPTPQPVAGVEITRIWYTVLDDRVCPICEPLHRTTEEIWGEHFPEGPPAHPNCRCFLTYQLNRPALGLGTDEIGLPPDPRI